MGSFYWRINVNVEAECWVSGGGGSEGEWLKNKKKGIQHETPNQLADSTKGIHKKQKVRLVSPRGNAKKGFCGERFLEKEIWSSV